MRTALPQLLLIVLAAALPLGAAPLTDSALLDWEYAANPSHAPAGGLVAFTRFTTDAEADLYRADIWLLDAQGRERRVTAHDEADYAPAWSPDGQWLAFLSNRDGSSQVYALHARGGDARKLSDIAGGVSAFDWSPDGSRIAVLARRSSASPSETTFVTDRLMTRSDGRAGYVRGGESQLAVVDVAAESPATTTWLTDGLLDVGAPRWSRDGSGVFFSAASSERDAALDETDIYVVAASGGDTPRSLTSKPGPDETPLPSPDGQWLAWTGFEDSEPPVSYRPSELYVMRPDGSEPRRLTAEWPAAVADGMAGDVNAPFGPVRRITWSADSRALYFTAAVEGTVQLVRADLAGPAVEAVTDFDEGEIREFDVAPDGRIVAVYSRPDFPQQIVSFPPERAQRGGWRQLTRLNSRYLEFPRFAAYEELRVPSFDGTPIQAWLIKPPRFDTRQRHPLILYVHGGPHSMYGTNFFHEFQVLAESGYFVLIANPRGSSGYGEVFGNVIQYRYPGDDYRDLMAVVDAVAQRDYIDEERLGVAGGSGGGLLTTWIVSQTDRFRAASAQRAVTNWLSFVGTADRNLGFVKRWFRDYPWRDAEDYLARSPLMRIDEVDTPVQIIHSEEDYRVPLEQALQYYTGLRMLDKPAELVVVPGESHGLSRGGSPQNRVERLNRILDWFDRYLKAE